MDQVPRSLCFTILVGLPTNHMYKFPAPPGINMCLPRERGKAAKKDTKVLQKSRGIVIVRI